MKKDHILLINVHSTRNGGDLALLECAEQQFNEAFDQPEWTVSANWPLEDYYRQREIRVVPSPWWLAGAGQGLPLVSQVLRLLQGLLSAWWFALGLPLADSNRWKTLLQAYRSADLVVGVAGNQFYSTGKYGWPFPLTCMTVYLAHLLRKPFYTMPQSLGPLKRWWERALVRWLYGKARKVYVRDAAARDLAQRLGIRAERLKLVPDPAFAYRPANANAAQDLLVRHGWVPGQPAIGATIISSMGKSLKQGSVAQYYTVMADVLGRCVRELGVRVFLFIQVRGPTRMEEDLLGTQTVLEQLADDVRGQVVVVDEEIHPSMFKACYQKMDFFLATRLHSGIFALGSGTPTVFVGYLTKTRGVLQAIGLQDWMVQIDDLSADELWQKIRQAWDEREVRAGHLRQIMPEIQRSASQTMIEIARDYHER